MFDIDGVEVLRGPQGTKFGPNAIAGAVAMHSVEPSKDFKMRAQTSLAEYNTRNFGLAVGGTIVEDRLLDAHLFIRTNQMAIWITTLWGAIIRKTKMN